MRTWSTEVYIGVAIVLGCLATPAAAQMGRGTGVAQTDTLSAEDSIIWLSPINVTATRTSTDVFRTPSAVTVLGREDIRDRAPDTVTDLFRELPGLDVNGVGTNQTRPTIRGQRGQRILLLEDGMRLNNTRRQQDFGELVGLVDISIIERVEVVRGPASVLYGSDAIGGVVNLITRVPGEGEDLKGTVRYRYSTHDTQNKVEASLSGGYGGLGLVASGTLRESDAYYAPAGTFGEIRLDGDVRVNDSGVQDESLYLHADYASSESQRFFAKFERYRADDAGFGFVDPSSFAPELPLIRILYPFQTFAKYTAGYSGSALGTALLDRLDVTGYLQDNERRLDLNVEVPLGPEAPPGASVNVHSENFTDIATFGLRIEGQKRPHARHILTYGLDLFRDDSENTDFSRTMILGLGPPIVEESDRPQVPNAKLRNLGVFLQDQLEVSPRATVILGFRYHDVRAATEATPGFAGDPIEDTDRTVVAAANGIFELTENINLVGSIGRGFRAPNLVERFFDGPTPEGGAFQSPNPDLEPETSLNVDLGARLQQERLYLEAFAFRNRIDEGIRIAPTGEIVDGLPEFRNVNVDELLFRGIELSGDVFPYGGLYAGGNYTWLDSEDANDSSNPVGESFSIKLNLHAGYRDARDRFWLEYGLRYNGKRDDVIQADNPIGSTLPAFTTHAIRAGATVLRAAGITQRIGMTIENLTDELYAESANASFFRPAAGRSLILTWDVSF
jgi:hemoglobin/transferrin/lactoferrin receptor protein